jgi:WhiB family redox-sensing transcriptional regulator
VSAESAPVGWLSLAACRGRPTEWWFPERGDLLARAVAVAICRRCPVRADCLADALALGDVGEGAGIRAGLSGYERVGIRRRSTVLG